MSSKNRNTLDIRKGQFFNNPPSLYVKGSKEEGRSGTRLSKPISASIGPWIFPSKDSVETSGSFLPPPVSRRSITTVLYLSGGGHRDRLSTSNQRRVEDKRAKKSWSKNRGGDAGLLLFSIRYFKRKQIVLLLLLRSSSPSQINPRSSQYAVFPTFGLLSRRSTRQLGLLRVRSMKIKLGLFFFFFLSFFLREVVRSIFFGRLNNIGVNFWGGTRRYGVWKEGRGCKVAVMGSCGSWESM